MFIIHFCRPAYRISQNILLHNWIKLNSGLEFVLVRGIVDGNSIYNAHPILFIGMRCHKNLDIYP
jgi:hypothetical protein